MGIENKIKEYAKDYGYKSANLKVLEDTIGKEYVPVNLAISHSDVGTHIKQHFKEFELYWEQFLIAQGDEKAGLTPTGKIALEKIRNKILETFQAHPLPSSILYGITENIDKDISLMIRSTGMEDSAELANPGGNESIAAVKNEPHAISLAVGQVIASYFSEKSFEQRIKGKDDIRVSPFMPVLVQRMIGESSGFGVVSGVMYTGSHGTRIQMAPGHGELIVNSKAPFDSFYVTPEGNVHNQIAIKPQRLVPKEERVNGKVIRKLEMVDNEKSLAYHPSVPVPVAKKIAEIGKQIEHIYGQPMDVEFVYTPSDDKIYVVQARPIPKGALKDVIPSTIKPERLKEVKQKGTVITGQVISPAGEAAHVITSPDEILICQDIEMALDIYLKQKDSKIKAIIVRNMAPSTSHEAAEFNSVGIPVIQVDVPSAITSMLQANNPCVIIDPQHKLILDWHTQLGNEGPNELLTHGLFKSSMSLQQTIIPPATIEPEVLESYFKLTQVSTDFNQQVKRIGSFNEILDALETIETAKPGSTQEAKLALKSIINILIKLSQSNILDAQLKIELNEILKNCLATSLEIDHLLDTITSLNENDFGPYQKELLDQVSRIEAIIVFPGNKDVFSNSLLQVLNEQAAQQAAKRLTENTELSKEQLAQFTQFLKLSSLTKNKALAEHWAHFSLECSLDPNKTSRLAQIVHFMVKKDLGSFMINTLFQRAVIKHGNKNTDEIFKDIYIQIANVVKNTKEIGLHDISSLIDKWQRAENNWATPDLFEKQIKEFRSDFDTILQKLDTIDLNTLGPTEKMLVFKEINRLTDVIDNSIKRFKGSMLYTDKTLQVHRFIPLLSMYHTLMERQVSLIPDEYITKYKEKIGSEKYVHKDPILKAISQVFHEKCANPDQNDLSSSRKLSVKSAIITSPASFERQFIDKQDDLTLEDFFTLFHQNIVAANTVLTQELNLTQDEMPPVIRALTESIEKYSLIYLKDEFPANLISARYNYPVYLLEYNIPLAMHAASFNVSYNEETNKMVFSIKIFGEARDRFQKIETFTKLYLEILGAESIKDPGFSNERSVLECDFSITPNSESIIYDAAKLIKMMARISFQDNSYSIADVVKMAENHPDRNAEIERNLPLLLNDLISKRGFALRSEDARVLINFCERSNISDTAKRKILSSVERSVLPSQWATQEGIRDFVKMSSILNPNSFIDILATKKFPKSSFLELALRAKEYGLAKQIISSDQFNAKDHPNAVSIILMDTLHYDILELLCHKGVTTNSDKIDLLKVSHPDLYAMLQKNNESPPSTQASSHSRLPRRNRPI